MLRYIHEVWYAESGEFYAVIETKKLFRQRLLAYYFDMRDNVIKANIPPLAFCLKASPNRNAYLVVPYVKRTGSPGLAYVLLKSVAERIFLTHEKNNVL